MVRLAIADNPVFELSDIEARRAGKSYSVDTIGSFRNDYPGDELFFIIGSDSFLEIGLWRRYAEIFPLCNLVVVERPGRPISSLSAALPIAIRGEFSYNIKLNPDKQDKCVSEVIFCQKIAENNLLLTNRLEHRSGQHVYFLRGCLLDISSTEIRQLAATGRSITYLIPPDVEAYIKEQRIYTE